jgi:hypothetical protein
MPLSLFLPLDDLKRNISKKELKEFYNENAEQILKKAKSKTKKIGFV